MNVRQARKALEHRIDDCIKCIKWKRFVRLHLASNLLTEIATVIEYGSRDRMERQVMVTLKSALLSKNVPELREAGRAWSEIQSGKTVGLMTWAHVGTDGEPGPEHLVSAHEIVDNGVDMTSEALK
jgi:hypothetical protein